MKLVKEYINEKFTDESDPIRDLGIGLYAHRDFNSIKEIYDYMYNIIFILLKIYNIRDIFNENFNGGNGIIKRELYEIINNYYIKYITLKGAKFPFNSRLFLDHLQNKKLYEKFTDQSDPIHDMGIGMMHNIKKYVEHVEPSAHREEYLWACCKHNNVEYLKILIDMGEDVHFEHEKPLCVACIYGHKKIIKILLDAGADAYKPGRGYSNALKIVEQKGYEDIVKMIKNHKNRKKSVNEKFIADSDPIKDLHIGYPEYQIKTKSWQVLKFIENKGEEGASLKEIQHFIWILNGHNEESFWEKSRDYRRGWWNEYPQRKTRGYWNTNLFGSGGSYFGGGHQGLLHKYCSQNPETHKWILKQMPKPYERFYK